MDAPLDITATIVVPPDELEWKFSRSGGPGGQGVNTTDSRVSLSWDVAASTALTGAVRERVLTRLADRLVDGHLVVVASEFRSQRRNRDAARLRLAAIVREAAAPPGPARRPTKPTRGSVRRRLDDKARRGQVKKLRRPDW